MANFEQALKWMDAGKPVRREHWYPGGYIYRRDDGVLMGHGASIPLDYEYHGLNSDSYNATNWELYEETKGKKTYTN
jgi:hypothetical protein